jgi:peptide/nickel transport system ATP-binding protein
LIRSVPSRNERGKRLHTIPGMTPSLLNLPSGCNFMQRCPRADAACHGDPETTVHKKGHSARCFHPHTGKSR